MFAVITLLPQGSMEQAELQFIMQQRVASAWASIAKN